MEEKTTSFLKEHALAIFLGVAGMICLGYGLFMMQGQKQADEMIKFQSHQEKMSGTKNDSTRSKKSKKITIDVEGAVQKPGVYQLSAEARTKDALAAAGGLSKDADRQNVAQNLNLAAPLTDGAKIYIPSIEEQMTGSSTSSEDSSGTVAGAATKQVNINQASQSELEALPGVGPVTAQKIISKRPYQNVQELVDKKAVGASVFGKIKDQIAVY